MPKRCVVIGASGGIGSAFVDHLLARDCVEQVYGFARSLVREPSRAEDFCQEAFVRLLERQASLDLSRPLLPLLLTIVRNLVISDARRSQPLSLDSWSREESGAYEPEDNAAEHPVLRLERIEECERLQHAMQQLPQKWRAALYLREGLAMSYRELGGVLEASEDTVRTLLHRARTRLASLLSQRNPRP